MVEDRRIYSKPPIQEAVCEIHFALDQPLDSGKQAQLQPTWRENYPHQKFVQEQQVTLHVSPEAVNTQARKSGSRLICRSEDGRRLVQLSGGFLAVNQLKPYPGWQEAFRSTILALSQEVQVVLGPIPFKGVVLRYINKIDVPQVPLVWEDWFKPSLPIPSLPNSHPRSLHMQFNVGLEHECALHISIASLPPTPDISPVILDLSVAWNGASTPTDYLRDHLERVHAPHRLAFEEYLSDNLRRLFE